MSQQEISQKRFKILRDNYTKFINNLNDPNKEQIRVFDPLSSKQLQELQLIREVSRQLQAKKDEDMRKVALAKEEIIDVAEERGKETEEEAVVQESKKEE